LAALMRALSRSILRCTLATVSSTLAMLAVVYGRWARRASRDFFPNRGDGVITCPAVVGYQGYVNARAGTRHVSCSCAQETTVPRRRNCRRGRGRVWEGGGRQWRSRRALVMSLGEQRFSSRIRWLSGAPLSPSSSSGVGKELKAAVYQKPRVRFGFVGREYETREVMTARLSGRWSTVGGEKANKQVAWRGEHTTLVSQGFHGIRLIALESVMPHSITASSRP
jgi:hypothetical protein